MTRRTTDNLQHGPSYRHNLLMGGSQIIRVVLMFILVGCGSRERQAGEFCSRDRDCKSGICASETCVEGDGDPDLDGLNNAWENVLGSNPFVMDTDGDGKLDRIEAGSNMETRPDVDGDGIPDVLESAILDEDNDCLPDEIDDSPTPATTHALLKRCLSQGVCTGNRSAECLDGQLICKYETADYQPIEQWCDGLDNDCDGQTDEGLFWVNSESDSQYLLGQSCQGIGECGQGTVICAALTRQPICSVQPCCDPRHVSAQPELCDGLDNDCDGVADEDLTLNGMPDGLPLGALCQPPGVCLSGTVECSSSTDQVVCSTGPGGSDYVGVPELCNGLDDNCDGNVDEGFAMVVGGQKKSLGLVCGIGNCSGGKIVCAHHQLGVTCSTDDLKTAEQCNGQDDDCDGETDEELNSTEAACANQGVCATAGALVGNCVNGIWMCAPAGLLPGYEPDTETTCDSLDNDCDGLTDESFVWTSAGLEGAPLPVGEKCGIGVCSGGIVECVAGGQTATCSSLVLATLEICDDIDNDCDGLVDEGLMWQGLALGETCDGIGACGKGTVVCDGTFGTVVCSSNPSGPLSEAQLEQCNGLDDDCDGQTDEGWSNEPALCAGSGVCATGGVVSDCVQGKPVCDYSQITQYQETETTCDGLDNDCDNLVDEDLSKKPGDTWTLVASGTPPHRLEISASLMPSAEVSGKQPIMVVGGASAILEDGTQPALADTWAFSHDGHWSTLVTEQPPGRSGASLVTDTACKRVIRFGGKDSSGGLHNDVWALGVDGEWTELKPFGKIPHARAHHAAVIDPASQWMWIFGGQPAGTGKAIAALDLSECSTQPKWLAGLKDGPGWRGGLHGSFISKVYQQSDGVGPFIMVFGGELPSGELSADTWLLDVTSGGWTPVQNKTAPPARRGHRTAYIDGHVYLFGGHGKMASELSDLWRFEPDAMKWQPLSDAVGPSGRVLPGFVVRDDHIVMLGGNAAGQALEDIWQLWPGDNPSWSKIALNPVPKPSENAFLAPYSPTQFLLYGGTYANEVQGAVWLYDTVKNGWTMASDVAPKLRFSAEAWRGSDATLFVHGGLEQDAGLGNGASSHELHKYQGGQWTKIPVPNGMPALVHHGMVWDKKESRLLIFGGKADAKTTNPSNELWSYEPATNELNKVSQAGQWPPGIWGHQLLYEPEGHRLVSVGGVGSLGKVYLLDLGTLQWSAILVHESMAIADPLAVFESKSSRLLVAYGSASKVQAWLLNLQSGAVSSHAFAGVKVGLSGTAVTYSAALGGAYVFGGQGTQAYTTNTLWTLPYSCP